MAENAVIDKAGELFSQKYFGIPFPVILGGVAVTAFVIRKLVKGQQASGDVASAPVGEGYAMDVSGNKFASAYTGQAGGVPFGSGSLTNAVSSGVAAVTPATEINNEGWLRRASEKLTNSGMWDSVFVQSALMKYVSGSTLNQREQAVANQAIKMEGQPPINVSPGGDVSNYTATVLRYIQPAGQSGVFAEYSDGSVKWIRDGREWLAITSSNPNLSTDLVQVPLSDQLWQRADVVQTKDPAYIAGEKYSRTVYPDKYSNTFLFSLPS